MSQSPKRKPEPQKLPPIVINLPELRPADLPDALPRNQMIWRGLRLIIQPTVH